jgi:hypothetical protein
VIGLGGVLVALVTRWRSRRLSQRRRAQEPYDKYEDAAQQGVISFLADLFLP